MKKIIISSILLTLITMIGIGSSGLSVVKASNENINKNAAIYIDYRENKYKINEKLIKVELKNDKQKINEARATINQMNKELKAKNIKLSEARAQLSSPEVKINVKRADGIAPRSCSLKGFAQSIVSGLMAGFFAGVYAGGVWFPPGWAGAMALAAIGAGVGYVLVCWW